MSNKLTLHDTAYPALLRSISDPPQQIYWKGDLGILGRHTLGIVGSRRPTPYGRAATEQVARLFGRADWVVVSGLAIGLDSVAHEGALAEKAPTVAVLPAGIDKIYPSRHHRLAERIVAGGGLLITEYPPGSEIYASNFIARNRIIAGLSELVVVTEAAERSGSLSTAAFALDEGRDVYAVPGSVFQPLAAGSNRLIANGAQLITSVEALAAELGLETTTNYKGQTAPERKLLAVVDRGVNDLETVQSTSGLSAAVFNQTVSLLEVKGVLRCPGGGQVLRTGQA